MDIMIRKLNHTMTCRRANMISVMELNWVPPRNSAKISELETCSHRVDVIESDRKDQTFSPVWWILLVLIHADVSLPPIKDIQISNDHHFYRFQNSYHPSMIFKFQMVTTSMKMRTKAWKSQWWITNHQIYFDMKNCTYK